MNKYSASFLLYLITTGITACGGGGSASEPTPSLSKVQLGEKLFSDANLSLNRTQSCATCHSADQAFVDPRENNLQKAVSVGDDGTSLEDRNTPTAAYAKFSPEFRLFNNDSEAIGGQFLDGREIDLKGQAGQPPLNPVEMGMPDKASVVLRLQENEEYVNTFKALFGETIFEDNEKAYAAMSESIATFEKTDIFSPFDSKYDRSLTGEYTMTEQERLGEAIFFSNQFTNCNSCHQLKSFGGSQEETFTDYNYHNLGVPVNSAVRAANGKGNDFVDHGLLDNPKINDPSHDGKFKVPTLRNVAVTAPYMHNGVFQDLRTVVLFYDKFNNPERINNPETGLPWRAPEVNANLALETSEFTAPALTDERVNALVAFMKLLTDKRYEDLIQE